MFWKPRVLLQLLQEHRGHRAIYKKIRGFHTKFIKFLNFLAIGKSVSLGHGAVDLAARLGPWWTTSRVDTQRGDASPMYGARALSGSGARQ
jgi:hypothetical protein